jgi:hypothetical protein
MPQAAIGVNGKGPDEAIRSFDSGSFEIRPRLAGLQYVTIFSVYIGET